MKSIKQKLFLAIVGVSALLMLMVWIFQVAFLEGNYFDEKKETMIEHTYEIVKIFDTYLPDETIESLKAMSASNNYCIEVYDYKTTVRLSVQPTGSESLFQDPNVPLQELIDQFEGVTMATYLYDNYKTRGNTPIYVSISKYESGNNNFIVFVASTLAPVKEAVKTIQNQLVFLTIILIAFSIIIAIIIADSLTKPILCLSKAAQKISKGDTDVTVTIQTKDEIGKLAEDFNTMTKEISRASKLQKELVANVSHDLRTPLTMIKGYAETIKDLTGDIKEKRDAQLDIIIEESNRLDILLTDILDLSKLQAGQLILEYSEFDIALKLQNIIKRYDLLTQYENYNFEYRGVASAMVYADEVKIEQVIYNILNNAVNHTGTDKRVIIELKNNRNSVVVSIRDTGAGIKPEHIPLIWDRYYKPYKKCDRKGMGTGLGLSIVKGILTAHNVKFGVDSTINKGSVFWFEVKKGDVE